MSGVDALQLIDFQTGLQVEGIATGLSSSSEYAHVESAWHDNAELDVDEAAEKITLQVKPCGAKESFRKSPIARPPESAKELSMVRLFLAILFAAFVTAAQSSSASAAPTGAGHPPLPPGMTEAMYKKIMIPGPPPPAGMPAGVVPMAGCIPTMGYHFANPKNAPFGPIYGAYNGKIIFTEIMVDQKLFAMGRSWDGMLKPLPGHAIDHVDFWFEPHGHPGYPIPHYDIHAWYVPHDEHMRYCGNTSGMKPPWM